MKIRYQPLILLFLLGLGTPGCVSTMKVKVDIIDRNKLLTAPEVLLMEVLAISEIEQGRLSNQFYEKQRDEILAAFNTVLDGLVQGGHLGINMRPILLEDLQKELNSVYIQKVIPELNSAVITMNTFFNEQPSKQVSLNDRQLTVLYGTKRKFNEARRLLNDFVLKLSDLQTEWQPLIGDTSGQQTKFALDFYKEIIHPTLRSAIKSNNQTNSLEILHKGLYDDPLNSFITQAPREYWRKMYNKTVAKNLLGDTDIAVVMETPGNFFIKGVRMDAENVTKHLANTFNTGVRFLGKVNGLDMGTRKMNTPNAATAPSTPMAEEIKTREAMQKMEIQEKVSKLSIINLMDAIIAQKDSLASDSGYSEALEQIKSIYSVHKTQLEITQKQ